MRHNSQGPIGFLCADRGAVSGLVCVVALVSCLAGCETAGWLAHVLGGAERTADVAAQYRGLDQKSVAVLVAASPSTQFQYPTAPLKICRAVSAGIAANVPGSRLCDPGQIMAFQQTNPQWVGLPTAQLLDWLEVDRIVMVDLAEYSMHEPGNSHVFRGRIAGRIGVAEADSDDPNNYVYWQRVFAQYPRGNGVSLLAQDEPMIELGVVAQFSWRVAGLFYDHKVAVQ